MKVKPNLNFVTNSLNTHIKIEPLRGDAGNYTIQVELRDQFGNKKTYYIDLEVTPLNISKPTPPIVPDPTDFDVKIEEDADSTLFWDFD